MLLMIDMYQFTCVNTLVIDIFDTIFPVNSINSGITQNIGQKDTYSECDGPVGWIVNKSTIVKKFINFIVVQFGLIQEVC